MRGNDFRWPNKLDCVCRKCFIGRHPSTCHAIHKLVAAIAMGERIQWKLFILREILRRVNYIDQFLIATKLECRKRKQQRRSEYGYFGNIVGDEDEEEEEAGQKNRLGQIFISLNES